ncbi:MAG: hypothetical protein H6741_20900 [Alphaproteobacteria bacterium]|nr:hypothetical protein [Alphaproteobacteria bacterium]
MSEAARAVKPFPVDEAVLAAIRPMQFRDAARVAELHAAAMGDSLWAKLGVGFLAELYRGLIESRRFLGFVYEEDGRVRGFIAGSTDASAMMSEVFRARWFLLGPQALPGIARRPGVLRHLVYTARYFAVSGDADLDVPAESLFCSFEPNLRGRRISGHINKVLFDDLLGRGHRLVKITTEVDNEGANRQLRSWGFEDRGRFSFYGKEMVRYVLDLEASPRVEPRLWHPSI